MQPGRRSQAGLWPPGAGAHAPPSRSAGILPAGPPWELGLPCAVAGARLERPSARCARLLQQTERTGQLHGC